jgi:hypothetical protein
MSLNIKPKSALLSFLALMVVFLVAFSIDQITYFNQGLLRQPSAELDRAYLGITNGGGGGSGTVTTVSVSGFSPLFTTAVATPTTTPSVSFSGMSQSGNLVFASPNGSSGVPGFRALVAADLPGGGGTVSTFSSGNLSPLFTTLVATPTTTPALSFTLNSQSQNLFFSSPNGSSGNPAFRSIVLADLPGSILTGVTNASQHNASDFTLISASNPPVVSLQSLSAGANVTLTEQGGTNIQIASTGGNVASGIDIPMTNTTAYANGTNFFIDLGWQASTLTATSAIAFNFSTNWSTSAATSRVSSVSIPATNFARPVYFQNLATNWHLSPKVYNIPPFRNARMKFEAYGQTDTNVYVTISIENNNVPNMAQVFSFASLTSVTTNLMWMDATRNVYQDQNFTVIAEDGAEVRSWKDQSGHGNNLTNFTTTQNSIYVKSATTSPFNIPSILITDGGQAQTWLKSPAMNLSAPTYVFMMVYGTKSQVTLADSLSGTSTRLACQYVNPTATIASENASSFTATVAQPLNYELFTFIFNGASSQIRTNAVAAATGSLVSVVANGVTFGSDINSTVPSSSTFIPEMVVFWGTLSATDLGNIETNYFRAKYQSW